MNKILILVFRYFQKHRISIWVFVHSLCSQNFDQIRCLVNFTPPPSSSSSLFPQSSFLKLVLKVASRAPRGLPSGYRISHISAKIQNFCLWDFKNVKKPTKIGTPKNDHILYPYFLFPHEREMWTMIFGKQNILYFSQIWFYFKKIIFLQCGVTP